MNRKILTVLLKVGISLGIVTYLVWDASKTKNGVNVFENLVHQPKHWPMLAAALGVLASGILLSFVRWWLLVRALGVPVPLRDAIRIGFWGFLFNLAPMGAVGGDLVKAVMLSREQHAKQASVYASVIVDRIIGLFILFVFASAAIVATGFWRIQVDNIDRICHGVFLVTGLGAAGIVAAMAIDTFAAQWRHLLQRLPFVGRPLGHLLEDMRLYRHRLPALIIASLMTFAIHAGSSFSLYLIARGLPGKSPPLSIHFVIVPLSISTGVVPLPMGPLEFVLEFFYTHLPMCGTIAIGQGLLVALIHRLNCIIVAFLGVLFYLRNRREVAEVMHESESQAKLVEN